MKKTVLFLAVASLMVSSADAQLFKTKKKVVACTEKTPVACTKLFMNDVDSMSYALGVNVGGDFSKNIKNIPGGKSNIDLIISGFATAMKGDSTLISKEEATECFKNYITKAQSLETDKKKLEGQQFLAQNMTKEGVKTTASGLQYTILKDAEGSKPKATDSVTVHYTGTLLDGKKFDSSLDRGQPITFPLNQVIPGWTEGVQLMSVGSKYKFFVPYTLGYGEQGTPNGGPIPGFSTLIFEVELLAIKPVIEAATPAEPKPTATTKKVSKSAPKAKK